MHVNAFALNTLFSASPPNYKIVPTSKLVENRLEFSFVETEKSLNAVLLPKYNF
jgi:hypothetical protein